MAHTKTKVKLLKTGANRQKNGSAEESMVSVKSWFAQFRNISETRRAFTVKEWIIGILLTQFSLHSNKDFQVLLQQNMGPQEQFPQILHHHTHSSHKQGCKRSSLQNEYTFSAVFVEQLASKETRFTEEETRVLLAIWEEEFNGFKDKKRIKADDWE